MTVLSLVQCLASFGDMAHQSRRRLQVPIGVRHVRMAEIGAECGDMAANGIAIMSALLERANGECVPQIVYARPSSLTGLSSQAD